MALTATMRRCTIALADSDRGHFVDLDLRVAQHPSETNISLVARLIVRALEDDEGLEFSRGLAADDEPALWQHNLRGELVAWIEVGHPSPERLHKAQKACGRVAVYAWRKVAVLASEIFARKIHRAETLQLWALDETFLARVAETLDRNNKWTLSKSGGALYLDIDGALYESTVETVALAPL